MDGGWNSLTHAKPEHFRDEYCTHREVLYKCPVYSACSMCESQSVQCKGVGAGTDQSADAKLRRRQQECQRGGRGRMTLFIFSFHARFVTAHNARMYRFCLVCVSLWVPKTDNFITTSYVAFIDPFRHVRLSVCLFVRLSVLQAGVWTHSGMSICLFVRLSPSPPRRRRAMRSSFELFVSSFGLP